MKKLAFFSILFGGIMLIGCSKPSTKAIPPVGELPPVSAPMSASAGGPPPAAANPAAGEVPAAKGDPKPIDELPTPQTMSID